jgi:hypothetical protein
MSTTYGELPSLSEDRPIDRLSDGDRERLAAMVVANAASASFAAPLRNIRRPVAVSAYDGAEAPMGATVTAWRPTEKAEGGFYPLPPAQQRRKSMLARLRARIQKHKGRKAGKRR